jgi:hypothetical protein
MNQIVINSPASLITANGLYIQKIVAIAVVEMIILPNLT